METDYAAWLKRRGALGPGAVPERIFFAGWSYGQRATAGNAAPTDRNAALEEAAKACEEFDMHGMALDIRELKAATPAATAAPGDLPEPIWNPLDTPEFREALGAYAKAHEKVSLVRPESIALYDATRKALTDFIEAWGIKEGARIASNAGAAIPEGFAIVPVEPTEDMVEAGLEQYWCDPDRNDEGRIADAYRSMLDAAPSNPPAGAKEQAK